MGTAASLVRSSSSACRSRGFSYSVRRSGSQISTSASSSANSDQCSDDCPGLRLVTCDTARVSATRSAEIREISLPGTGWCGSDHRSDQTSWLRRVYAGSPVVRADCAGWGHPLVGAVREAGDVKSRTLRQCLWKGYKDAAAVITGSVLEEHLRKLADKFAVPVMTASGKHVKADTLNADLVKAKAYNKLEQKDVTAWLGLRNDAAHGHYDNYSHEQVVLMLGGIRGYMIRHAA